MCLPVFSLFKKNKRSDSDRDGFCRLIYVSRAKIDDDADLQSVLDDITKVASKKNKLDNITGALMYCDGWFLQALEGKSEAVDRLFLYICKDERHSDVRVIESTIVDSREFERWHMASFVLSKDNSDKASKFDPEALTETSALHFLRIIFSMGENQVKSINI